MGDRKWKMELFVYDYVYGGRELEAWELLYMAKG